jgi:SprT protein
MQAQTFQQMQAIEDRVNQCIKTAEAQFGITMPKVYIRFDLKGRAAGMAVKRGDFYTLRFNAQHIRLGGQTYEHLLNDTVPHEVAHTVCQAFPKFGKNHDAGWKQVCKALGGNGQRCYGEDDAPEAIAAARPYVYITTAGHECRVTKVVHSKIQQGTNYVMKGGKGKLTRECQYNYMTAPKPAVVHTKEVPVGTLILGTSTVSVPVKHPTVKNTATNADLIRTMIRNGWTDEQIINRAITELGMKTALAKTYIKNNRNKV